MLLLWVFILLIVMAIKNDMFGTGKNGKGVQKNASELPHSGIQASLSAPTPAVSVAHAQPTALVIEGGSMNGARIPLDDADIVFGRSKNATVVLRDSYVSLMHMRVFKQNNKWYAEDLDSTNGTYIDGEPLIGITEFNIGQRIDIGDTTIRLKV
jgi:pSer/pThr/pTyr-binding forkhead associated (FHA) protein